MGRVWHFTVRLGKASGRFGAWKWHRCGSQKGQLDYFADTEWQGNMFRVNQGRLNSTCISFVLFHFFHLNIYSEIQLCIK